MDRVMLRMRILAVLATVAAVMALTLTIADRMIGSNASEAAPAITCSTPDPLADQDGDGIADGYEQSIGTGSLRRRYRRRQVHRRQRDLL